MRLPLIWRPLLIVAGSRVASAQVAELAIDWHSFLARADPVWAWNSTDKSFQPDEWVRSLFGGNAQLGFMLFHDEGDEVVRIAISRADVYDDRTNETTPDAYMNNFVYDRPRLPIGSLQVTFSSPVLGAEGRIVLHDAEAQYNVTTTAGAILLRVWACAAIDAADAIIVEASGVGGESASVVWVPSIAQSTWAGRDSHYRPNPPPLNASSLSAGGVLNVTTQPHLSGTAHSTAVWQSGAITIVSTSTVLPSGVAADAWASREVLAAAAAGVEALRVLHRAWWGSFWTQGGSVFLDYSVLEELYYLQVYKFGSAARRGRAFHDLMGPWFIDETNAPDVHWDWNIVSKKTLSLAALSERGLQASAPLAYLCTQPLPAARYLLPAVCFGLL
jgi:alpha-L-fucosidase 2